MIIKWKFFATVVKIVDGDTYDLVVDLGFRVQKEVRVRLAGFDTPEIYRPSCQAELEHGRDAKAFVEQVMPVGSQVLIETHKDKAGIYGRWGADVWLADGRFLGLLLEDHGLLKKDIYEVAK